MATRRRARERKPWVRAPSSRSRRRPPRCWNRSPAWSSPEQGGMSLLPRREALRGRTRSHPPLRPVRRVFRVTAMNSQRLLDTLSPLRRAIQRWWHDEAAVTAIEYGLMAALIAVIAIGGFAAMGTSLNELY